MSIRDYAADIVKNLPDDKLNAFLMLFADQNELARIETDTLSNDPSAKRFKSVDELFEDLDN